ncbi:MAG: cytochrome c biogenesis protein CcsA [Candidatus Marinimicrobia bacterium]|nr:cytochrome c biogenesis protein CcsA [Candidatus Neomarinimicrobiota bacterium]
MDTLLILRITLPIFYGVTLYLYTQDFRGILKELSIIPTIAFLSSIAVHIIFLILLYYSSGKYPIGSLFGTMTTFVLLFSIIYMMIEFGVNDRSFGIFVLVLVLFLQIVASIFINPEGFSSPLLEDLIFEIHVISLIISYSAFAIGAITAVMYLLLSKKIKNQELDIVYHRLPTLQYLRQVGILAVYFGFVFLTAGIALGFFNASQVPEADISISDPKIVSVGITWLIYGMFVLIHLLKKLTAKLSINLSLIGFITILFTFFVVNTLMETFHLF